MSKRILIGLLLALGVAASCMAQTTIRVGAFPNITHAQAMVGKANGWFDKAMGPQVKVQWTSFNAGPAAIEALFGGAIHMTYVGPNPAINGYVRSNGEAVRVVAGAASGGASLIVRNDSGIQKPEDFHGKRVASPQFGNTQDVALRYWLKQNGVTTTTTGGGDAFIKPTTPNSAAVLEFKSGQVAGGSEPAPYDIEMVQDGGTVLLSEPGVTTILVVTQSLLSAHPAIVADLIKAQVQANDFIKSNPTAAQADANAELGSYTGKPLKASLVAAAFKEITFTDDPDASSLTTDASQATSLGLLKPVSLSGIFDLTLLNTALAAAGESQVSS